MAQDLDISDHATLADLSESLGLPAESLNAASDAGDLLDTETQAAIDAGVFGSPFYQSATSCFGDKTRSKKCWSSRNEPTVGCRRIDQRRQ